MTEIEMHIDTLEKLIPEIEMGMNLFSYDRSALQAALQALRRTAEHDKAREEGRLVELPIPVGGDRCAYGIYEDDGTPAHIVTIDCDELDGLEVWPTGEIVVRVDGWEIGSSDIGKTVFLTRQEAEDSLKKAGEGK